MTSTPIARIVDTARITCAGALDGIIRLETFNTFKEFFNRTNAWLFQLPVYIVPTANDYVIDTTQNAIVSRLMYLGRPDNQPFTAPIYAPGCPPQFILASSTGSVESFRPDLMTSQWGILLNAGLRQPVLRIYTNPQVNETWLATLALNVTDPTDPDGLPDGPPDWVVEKYYDILSHGVISKLMVQAGKPYSSPQGAEYHGRKFNQGVGTARSEVRNMFLFDGQSWQYPRGWMSRAARRNY